MPTNDLNLRLEINRLRQVQNYLLILVFSVFTTGFTWFLHPDNRNWAIASYVIGLLVMVVAYVVNYRNTVKTDELFTDGLSGSAWSGHA